MENLISHISMNPDIRFGKPCIAGTRIAVTDILQWMASGMSYEEILSNYPVLQDVHIRAALSFAAKPSDFFGTLNISEGETFQKYVTNSRLEWDRNI